MDNTQIRALRRARGLTQKQLAEQLGVCVASVEKWESGRIKPSRLAVRELNRLQTTTTGA